MTRDEFLSLPPTVALRVLLDAFPSLEQKLAAVPKPVLARRPRYDFSIYRKDGVQWASETDIEGLSFWRKRYQESAESGSEWAAKDAKKVKNLDAWIAWRLVEPSAQWSGERNDADVIAAPPSGKPRVHPKRARSSTEASDDASGYEGGESGLDAESFNY